MFHRDHDFIFGIWNVNNPANIDGFEHRNFCVLKGVLEAVENFVVAAALLLDVPDHGVEQLFQGAVLEGHEVAWQASVLVGQRPDFVNALLDQLLKSLVEGLGNSATLDVHHE